MGVSREGTGQLYRYVVCPAGIFVFVASLFGAYVSAIGGYFAPQFFGE